MYVRRFLSVINCRDSDIFAEWRQSVKLVVLFLINNIFNSNNFSFSLKNDMVLLPASWIWILYIEDLCDIFGKNKWLFSVIEKSKIDISYTILVGLHSIWESDPLAMKQWDLQIFSILQLSDLLYEPIVGFHIAITVICISSNIAILVGFLVVLCPCIKCIAVNVIKCMTVNSLLHTGTFSFRGRR
jgi:hypothetical protein